MLTTLVAKAIPIIIGILIFGVLILVHEWGHFMAAKKSGICVEEFAIGMGPLLFSVQKGETLYSIRAFPMGGFCKMLGDVDDVENISSDRAFNSKPIWKRIIVILAGASMNILLAVALFFVVSTVNGISMPIVSSVMNGMPAQSSGLLPGDTILKVNGSRVHIYEDLQMEIGNSKGENVNVVYKRNGVISDVSITPKLLEGAYKIGVTPVVKTGIFEKSTEGYEHAGLFESIAKSFWQIFFWIKLTFYSIGELIMQNISVNEMSGPIGVVSLIGSTYEQTMEVGIGATIKTLLNFAGILSASIGIFNLLPIPALDGGRFIFLLIEGVRGKPISAEKEGMVHFVGFALLMAFGVFIAFNDVIKLLL